MSPQQPHFSRNRETTSLKPHRNASAADVLSLVAKSQFVNAAANCYQIVKEQLGGQTKSPQLEPRRRHEVAKEIREYAKSPKPGSVFTPFRQGLAFYSGWWHIYKRARSKRHPQL